MKKNCCWMIYKWAIIHNHTIYQSENHIRDKVKAVLDLSNYETKKELDHDTGVDTSDLAAEKIFLL